MGSILTCVPHISRRYSRGYQASHCSTRSPTHSLIVASCSALPPTISLLGTESKRSDFNSLLIDAVPLFFRPRRFTPSPEKLSKDRGNPIVCCPDSIDTLFIIIYFYKRKFLSILSEGSHITGFLLSRNPDHHDRRVGVKRHLNLTKINECEDALCENDRTG